MNTSLVPNQWYIIEEMVNNEAKCITGPYDDYNEARAVLLQRRPASEWDSISLKASYSNPQWIPYCVAGGPDWYAKLQGEDHYLIPASNDVEADRVCRMLNELYG